MNSLTMNPEAKLILAVAKAQVSNLKGEIENLLEKNGLDWEKFKKLAAFHGLSSFSYPAIKECLSLVPTDTLEFFKRHYYASLLSSAKLWQEFLCLSDAFSRKGIIMVPLKGISLLADIYAENPFRAMVDIDILIKDADLAGAEEIFLSLGFEKELYDLKEEYWLDKQCHLSFHKKQSKSFIRIDAHFGLDFKRKNSVLLPRLWERIIEVSVDGRMIKLLSWEDALFSLALHLRRFGNILSLKNVLDLALILKKHKVGFDWDYVLKEAVNGRICSSVYFIILQASLFLDADIPSQVWRDLRTPFYKKLFLRNLIKNNTFSLNTKQKTKEIYLKSHFLLYDSLWEPLSYVVNIPQEQFAKFYGLSPYDKKTDFLYRNRFLYIPLKSISYFF